MSAVLFNAEKIWTQSGWLENAGVLTGNGFIRSVGPAEELRASVSGEAVREHHFPGKALIPGTINVHNHSFQSLLRGFGDDLRFLEWRANSLYKYSPRIDREGVHTGALLAFGEMLKYGVTTVCDFFYLHDGGNENSRAVIQAAKELGINLVLARCMYDWRGAPARYLENPDDSFHRTVELHREFQSDPGVLVCPAPHSPHGASVEMFRAGVAAAAELGCKLHFHLAEEEYQVKELQEKQGFTMLEFLDQSGAANSSAVAVHCCWLNEEEIREMGRRGMGLAYCPASNMFLGDGVTPIPRFIEAGWKIGLGTDGGCTNSRTSVFDEMRTCALLHKVDRRDAAAVAAEQVFEMGTAGGGEVLGVPAGRLETGRRADFVVINPGDISLQPANRLIKNVVYSMAPSAIESVWVRGECVCREGRLLGLDEEKIVERVRRLTADW
ncbi:MAG: 5-methylthioadenosine/S-adenosylhomocysteine deaminase [Myxococcota bacterium]|nr:5-methylthioadenosine/S-adenosylhomocysteine deaminase [Myxococcota bacterium]